MKLRVTLMTENDKHVGDEVTDERILGAAEMGWNTLLKMLSGPDGEEAYVENVELVER